MGLTPGDLERRGLTGCAILFTGSAIVATFCCPIVVMAIAENLGVSGRKSLYIVAASWLVWMAITWWRLARSRSSWIHVESSTSLFHIYPFIVIALGGVFQLFTLDSGTADKQTFGWVMLSIDVVLTLFYFSYVFLGITLRARMRPIVVLEFFVILVWTCWSVAHHP